MRWGEFSRREPELAERVRVLFETGRHKTLATLRADGSPRISGIECEFTDTDLRFGCMPASRKGADLGRDPRFALHGPTSHPGPGREAEWSGEAKVAGVALDGGPIDGPDGPAGTWYLADLAEVVVTGLDEAATMLVIESWTPESGVRRVERA